MHGVQAGLIAALAGKAAQVAVCVPSAYLAQVQQLTQQMQQMQAMLQQMQQKLQEKNTAQMVGLQKTRETNQSKERIAVLKEQNENKRSLATHFTALTNQRATLAQKDRTDGKRGVAGPSGVRQAG